jgi:branched-chain amino acid transport system permease protein
MLWFGLFFVVLVLYKPEGIAGIFQAAPWRKTRAAGAPRPAPQSMAS